MDDILYFCRVEGEEHWYAISVHPYRPLDGIAELYAEKRKLKRPVTIEIKNDRSIDASWQSIEIKDEKV